MRSLTLTLLVAVALVALAAAVQPPQVLRRYLDTQPREEALPDLWYTQTLDHFNRSDTRTWKQRYWMDKTYYKPGNPIFIQFGEEAPMDSSYVTGLQMANYGRAHNAMLIAIEHRFYGESKPLPSLATDNLRYLSVTQALADFNAFIASLKEEYGQDTKVVTFGCSYIGAGTAWFMSHYPDAAVGGVASSAPVEAVVDMVTYLEQVGTSISEMFGPQCDQHLTNATQAIVDLLANGGESQVSSMFNVCPGAPLSNPLNLATFMSSIAGPVMGTVQYVNENKAKPNITAICDVVMRGSTPLEGLRQLIADFQQGECIDASYADSVRELQNLDQSSPLAAARSWTWQTCTEFGYYQSTDSKKQPFYPGNMIPVSYYLQMCNDIFGVEFNVAENVHKTNAMYYGNKINAQQIHNTVFDNSRLDPWHTLSVQQSVSPSVPLLLFGTEGHCAAIMPNKTDDPQSILSVRRAVAQNIDMWLA